MNFQNVTLVVNPISGGRRNKQAIISQIQTAFSNRDAKITTRLTGKRGDATDFAREAVQQNQDLVVAVGGDGTLNEVATGLVNSPAPMAIVPLGSGNGFARTLDIPMRVAGALEVIQTGRVVSVDVGKVNERYFFLVTGVGFDAVVGHLFDSSKRRGPLPYFYLGVKGYMTYRPEKLKMHFDGDTLDLAPFVVAIANGRQYGNNALIASAAKMNDGLLNVVIIPNFPLSYAFTQLHKLFRDRMASWPDAVFGASNEVIIERERDGYINLDGEPVLEKARLELRILPACLKVIAPQKTNGLL